ncbi:MAG: aminocarboxymuconate-semialdehyde decarboxylase [Solirubrobacteraceae bacterium]|jgi:aminocarboxymuconate-semialdehyde decarboxylase|nr:aminocarboxymuconate-semialdehyde decarboxylase [Solirubrobacteraceae bacterium]
MTDMAAAGPRVVDSHSHFLPAAAVDLIRRGEHPLARIEERPGSGTWVVAASGLQFPLTPLFYDIEAKLAWMDDRGIDVSLTSIAAPFFMYELAPEDAGALAQAANDAAATLARESGGRLIGVATVPLCAPELAAAELERACGELGLKGVEIGTSFGETMLDDPSLDPFFSAAERLDVPVFLHPYTSMLGLLHVPGFERFFLLNTVGNPLETHLAAARLILGGVFDRHPDLTVQLSHGGGGLPFQLARLDRTYALREQVRELASRPPSEYVDRFLFDTVLYDWEPLEFLIGLVGVERVVFGTDHPFDVADTTGLEVARRLDADEASAVLGANATRAYGL